jgi:hypothetical protein
MDDSTVEQKESRCDVQTFFIFSLMTCVCHAQRAIRDSERRKRRRRHRRRRRRRCTRRRRRRFFHPCWGPTPKRTNERIAPGLLLLLLLLLLQPAACNAGPLPAAFAAAVAITGAARWTGCSFLVLAALLLRSLSLSPFPCQGQGLAGTSTARPDSRGRANGRASLQRPFALRMARPSSSFAERIAGRSGGRVSERANRSGWHVAFLAGAPGGRAGSVFCAVSAAIDEA